ncbi:uncharacterized protein N7529_011234 [Penicillium soppii]|uniref:uncharacterized protein n=1 Tax=Penicillium soppii TaxID=69789 RepID=UPI002546B990|nr:uncharacterized protein N7529_011234 [Penicillium soppii]KAJ5851849.1 hypothetical protein N7529_011234 [Penicillium soppii]
MSMTERDSDTITDTTKAMFADIMDDVLEINRGALDAISTLESAWDKMSNKEDLSAEENTQINFYMAMYGTFKETDSTGMDRAKRRNAQLRYFANEYVEGLDKDSFHIRIICHDSGWELIEYDDEDLFVFDDGADGYAIRRESNVQNSVCQNDKGQNNAIAFMIHGRDGHDYMTICPLGWETLSGAIPVPVQKARSLSDLEYEDFDDVAKKSADGVFVHELTHSKDFWGALAKDDVSLDDETKAYGFEAIVELAKQGNSEDDASKLRAGKNADTYKYWAVGE